MDFIQAVLLGIIEGLTEFLPISSTGHLIITEEYMGFKDTAKTFTVAIQLGAVAAVVWYYRLDLISKLAGLTKGKSEAGRFWLNLLIATIPAGIIGFLFDKQFESAGPTVVAVALIIGGVILWLVDSPSRFIDTQQKLQLNRITHLQALLIGLAQCIALVPGVSRSGASIVGGLMTGLNRLTATTWAFYMSIPILGMAGIYKLLTGQNSFEQVSGGGLSIVIGTVTSFLVALLAISWLLRYVANHNFRLFAYYRIILGLVVLAFLT